MKRVIDEQLETINRRIPGRRPETGNPSLPSDRWDSRGVVQYLVHRQVLDSYIELAQPCVVQQ